MAIELKLGDKIRNVIYDEKRKISKVGTLDFLGEVIDYPSPYKVSVRWETEPVKTMTCPRLEMNNFRCMYGDFIYKISENHWLDKYGNEYDDNLEEK